MFELKRFLYEEEAMGTVEVVLIVAVLIGIGLLFKNSVVAFVENHLSEMESVDVKVRELKNDKPAQ